MDRSVCHGRHVVRGRFLPGHDLERRREPIPAAQIRRQRAQILQINQPRGQQAGGVAGAERLLGHVEREENLALVDERIGRVQEADHRQVQGLEGQSLGLGAQDNLIPEAHAQEFRHAAPHDHFVLPGAEPPAPPHRPGDREHLGVAAGIHAHADHGQFLVAVADGHGKEQPGRDSRTFGRAATRAAKRPAPGTRCFKLGLAWSSPAPALVVTCRWPVS